MMKSKKQIRQEFRDAVFKRDNYTCQGVGCSKLGTEETLDAHHITDRDEMPNGGYVKENGISLCPICHFYAEEWHSYGHAPKGYQPKDLYEKISSSYEEAVKASERLTRS